MHRTRNAAYGQPYRGFESLPLRHTTLIYNNYLVVLWRNHRFVPRWRPRKAWLGSGGARQALAGYVPVAQPNREIKGAASIAGEDEPSQVPDLNSALPISKRCRCLQCGHARLILTCWTAAKLSRLVLIPLSMGRPVLGQANTRLSIIYLLRNPPEPLPIVFHSWLIVS